MAGKAYGKGTIKELVPGKRYRIDLSGGADPRTGVLYGPGDEVPDGALAVVRTEQRFKTGRVKVTYKPIEPRLRYEDATEQQRAAHPLWQTPTGYLKRRETFMGTRRQAELRVESIRRELELLSGILELGVDEDELPQVGLTLEAAVEDGMNAKSVLEIVEAHRAKEAVPTVSEVMDSYLEHIVKYGKHRKTGKPLTNKTKADYRNLTKHVSETLFGRVKVTEATQRDVKAFLDELRDSGLGEATVTKVFNWASRVLESARRDRIISFNPCDELSVYERPVRPKPNREALSENDMVRLVGELLSMAPTAFSTVAVIGACNGIRLSEILGLDWGCVHLDAPTPYIEIVQQHTRMDGTHETKTKETHVSPLDALTVDHLTKWRLYQKNMLNGSGVEIGDSTPVCSTAIGTRIDSSNFHRWWHDFCTSSGFGRYVDQDGLELVELTVGDDASLYDPKAYHVTWRDSEGWPCDAAGKRYSRTYKRPEIVRRYDGLVFHELRHTYFTRRAEEGVDIKTLQVLGGWTTPQMLLNVYTHGNRERAIAVGGCMDEIMKKAVEQHG